MPRRPAPLPPALAGRVFTRREALDRLSLSSDRLRSLDLRQVTHGAHRAVVERGTERLGAREAVDRAVSEAAARRTAAEAAAARALMEDHLAGTETLLRGFLQ